jgi:hypothetical protein
MIRNTPLRRSSINQRGFTMSSQLINIGGKDFNDSLSQVIRRASVDPEFRNLALKNGNAALEKLNPGLTNAPVVRFLDRSNPSPFSVELVLPDLVEAGELSEQELEQVAGGAIPTTYHGVDVK